jgi:hypothetical protein
MDRTEGEVIYAVCALAGLVLSVMVLDTVASEMWISNLNKYGTDYMRRQKVGELLWWRLSE